MDHALRLDPGGQQAEPEHAPALRRDRAWEDGRSIGLPTLLTPLIGREQDTATAQDRLRQLGVRLLTLTGPGGVGKTRLALQLAADVAPDFPDGVFFVSLAPVTDPALVIPTVASALGIADYDRGAASQFDRLRASLQDQRVLLVLDNFEQVLAAAPSLTGLLAACARLKVLVTSRAALRVRGEHEYTVSPLALPSAGQLSDVETLTQVPAVALFLDRARAVAPGFRVTQDNAAAIAGICARLDGLPLAIELAAVRVKLLSPQALLHRLDHRFHLLTGGIRDLPARQQTLRDAIGWSYDLLDAHEQRLFRRLAVFVGGCTLDAAARVCNSGGDLPADFLDGVASLADKSLIRQEEQGGDEPRVGMLETLREYGLEQLAASGEDDAVRDAHAAYALALAEEAEHRLTSPEQRTWLERLDREHSNLRAALRWLQEQGRADRALRLGSALWRFWLTRGHLGEGRRWIEASLASSADVPARVRAKALNGAGMLAHYQGEYTVAAALCGESLTIFRQLGDQAGMAAAINGLALVARSGGDYSTARAMYEESQALLRELGDRWGLAYALTYQGVAAWMAVDYPAAHRALEEGLALAQAVGDRQTAANALHILGRVALAGGEYAVASALLDEAAPWFREVGDRRGVARSFEGLAEVALRQGNLATARAWHREALVLLKDLGERWFIALCLEELAGVAMAEGQPEQATRLLGAASALREATGAVMPVSARVQTDRLLAAARTALGEARCAAALAQGRTLTLDQIIAAQASPPADEQPADASEAAAQPSPLPRPYPAGLTAREVEVLRLVAQGWTDAQVAEQLVVSPRTVQSHLSSIYSKLGVTSRSAATRYAIHHHLA
ncbi:MAG: tetratricopeptide repeat protein [Chloroflexi bacterium]|nr:tetratricopeptide repeat protein [Chloroflexota bacterium]